MNPNFKHNFEIIVEQNLYKKFEVYKSFKDNQEYIALIKRNNLDIFSIKNNKKILSLKGNKSMINTIRYFINNKNFNEYLISSDYDRIIIIWDITNDFNIKHKIDMKLSIDFIINSCLLVFTHNKDDYIISTAVNCEEEFDESSTKIFLFNDGKFIREIINSNNLIVYYLLSWHNKNNDNYYIVQNCNSRILINNLFEEKIYSEFNHQPGSYFYKGFIYNQNEKDYLCCCSTNGYINIWDLYNKIAVKIIYFNNYYFTDVIQWNEKYIIVIDSSNNNCGIIDIEKEKMISNIKSKDDFWCIKKIYHQNYGESLITSGKNKIEILYI